MPTAADIQSAGYLNSGVSDASGYLTPMQLVGTPQGQQWLDNLYNLYYKNMQAGVAGYGMPQNAMNGQQYANAGDLRGMLNAVAQNPSYDPQLYNWMMQQGGMPTVPTLARDTLTTQKQMADDAQKAAAQLAQMQVDAQKAIAQLNADTQLKVSQGQITSNEAIARMQIASAQTIAEMDNAYKYAELAWTKTYGEQNLQILRDQTQIQRDRLGLDRETSMWQKANDERRVAVEEGRLGIERDKFGLDKSMQEAQLRANPFNAVANALYTRGQGLPNTGTSPQGAPLTTLDNSGTLPFLQQLMSGQGIQPMGNQGQQGQPGGMFLNQGGIGGNFAPAPNAFSQQSMQNMSGVEQGIATSLAQYGGWDPNDYWKQAQNSWNTAGQRAQNFGGTRLA